MKLSSRHILEVGSFGVNATILAWGQKAVIVDPGSEEERLLAFLEAKNLELAAILLTHGHFDHIGGVNGLQRRHPDLRVFVGEKDHAVLTHPLNEYPPDYPAIEEPKNIVEVKEGPLKDFPEIAVLETPGHTPGGVSYYLKEDNLLLSGDTLFAGSAGRTDLPGGDMATLLKSLERLKALPKETEIIPGHGPTTTLAAELKGNPFLMN